MKQSVLLIDGHSILNRAFYGLPDLTNAKGQHTGAVYGFLNIMFRIIDMENPDYLVVAFDKKAPTFRHKMFEEYKGTRKGMPEELREQVPLMKEVLEAMNIEIMSMDGYEADDLLGTIGNNFAKEGYKVNILSGDKDLLQLVTDQITILLPKTAKGKSTLEVCTPKWIEENFDLEPKQIIDLKGLMGDTADNIPGIPGIGVKTATKLLKEYKTIENVLDNVDNIKGKKVKEACIEFHNQGLLSKTLATIITDAPIEINKDTAKVSNFYTEKAFELFKELQFKNLYSRFDTNKKEDNNAPRTKISLIKDNDELRDFLENSKKRLAINLVVNSGEVIALSLGSDEEKVSGLYINDKTKDIIKDYILNNKDKIILSMDIKELIKYLGISNKINALDIKLGAYLLNPNESDYSYEYLLQRYGSISLDPENIVLQGNTIKKLAKAKGMEIINYSGNYTICCLNTIDEIIKKLEEENMLDLYKNIELPLLFTLNAMENNGILVSKEELLQMGEKLTEETKALEQEIYKEAGEEFNINSPKQLGVILFEKLNLPFAKKTKTGYSTSADILDKLKDEYTIVKNILQYRTLSKLYSTYIVGLINEIQKDGKIHTTFNQTITATGRISSTEPNLQNIPIRMEIGRLIRKAFVPKEGYCFVDGDYSQIELRVLAHLSGDETLINAFESGVDIHRLTASQVFHVPFDDVTDKERRAAKAVNFGIIYGISAFSLGEDLSISRAEANEYIEKYFATYPKIKTYLDGLISFGKEHGFVLSAFNRKRPVPELNNSNFMVRSFGERVAMNSPIQGTAADIMKIAMNKVFNKLKEEKLDATMLIQVHDELLLEVKNEEVEKAIELLKSEMENAVNLTVPLLVDVHSGNNWYEVK